MRGTVPKGRQAGGWTRGTHCRASFGASKTAAEGMEETTKLWTGPSSLVGIIACSRWRKQLHRKSAFFDRCCVDCIASAIRRSVFQASFASVGIAKVEDNTVCCQDSCYINSGVTYDVSRNSHISRQETRFCYFWNSTINRTFISRRNISIFI